MSKININLSGTVFPIHSTEDEEYTIQLASKLNTKLDEIITATRSRNITTNLVITSLTLLDEQQQLCHEIKSLVDMNKQLEEQMLRYSTLLSEVNRELETYRAAKESRSSTESK